MSEQSDFSGKVGVNPFLYGSANKAIFKRDGIERFPIYIRITFNGRLVTFRSNYILFLNPPARVLGRVSWVEFETFVYGYESPLSSPLRSLNDTASTDYSLTDLNHYVRSGKGEESSLYFTKAEFDQIKASLKKWPDALGVPEKLLPIVRAISTEIEVVKDICELFHFHKISIIDAGATSIMFMMYPISKTLEYWAKGSLFMKIWNSPFLKSLEAKERKGKQEYPFDAKRFLRSLNLEKEAHILYEFLVRFMPSEIKDELKSFGYLNEFYSEVRDFVKIQPLSYSTFYWLKHHNTVISEFEKHLRIRKSQWIEAKLRIIEEAIYVFFTFTQAGGYDSRKARFDLLRAIGIHRSVYKGSIQ